MNVRNKGIFLEPGTNKCLKLEVLTLPNIKISLLVVNSWFQMLLKLVNNTH